MKNQTWKVSRIIQRNCKHNNHGGKEQAKTELFPNGIKSISLHDHFLKQWKIRKERRELKKWNIHSRKDVLEKFEKYMKKF